MKYINIDGFNIVVSGVFQMYSDHGLPISIAVERLELRGMRVSWPHIADEMLKFGMSRNAVMSKIREEIALSNVKPVDLELLERFVQADYEEQRQIIFDSLFRDRKHAEAWAYTSI